MMNPIKNFFKRHNNYVYIAENMALIYHALKNSKYGENLTEPQLLFATAYIDMYQYIVKDDVLLVDVEFAVDFTYKGIIGLLRTGFRDVKSTVEDDSLKKLAILTMQIESLIFSIDTKTNKDLILNTVISEQKIIEETIVKTIDQGVKNSNYKKVMIVVDVMSLDAEFNQRVEDMKMKFSTE